MENLAEKITLLNQITLQSLNESRTNKILEKFTEAGIKIMGADFGFVWLNISGSEDLELAYKSPSIPFEPLSPRKQGTSHSVMSSKNSFLVSDYPNSEFIRDDARDYLKSVAIIPLFFQNISYGSIFLCFKDRREFDITDESLATFIGNSAAQALTINRLLKSEQVARQDSEAQQERFKALIENSYEVIALLSPEGEILYISPSATKISGYEQGYLTGRNMSEFIHDKDLEFVNQSMKKTLQNPEIVQTLEFRYKHKDGSWRWAESTSVNMLNNPSVDSIVVNIRDITERKLSQETILHQALHDPLTSLPNRKEFIIRLNQALESAKRHKRMLAVMFLDMDRFKNINDSFGHSVGDTLLKVVATRLTSCLRAEDAVARFGGDEFLIMLNEIHSSQQVIATAEKILKAIALPVQVGDHTFHLSVSLGIAVYPHDGEDAENLKKHADMALYQAKKNGRNGYSFYDPAFDPQSYEKFLLENELRLALVENQIVLYYQPIINLKTGKVLAMEALARWQHPTKGLLLPGDFIPLAEETGLILALSEYVLKSACSQYKAWEALGFGKFRIAVNLSAQSFAEEEFIPQLGAILEEYNMGPGSLEIEITESIAMENLELTGLNLKQLKKLGVRITIDDFGTGYSSLSYLKRFPLHNLKIDRSFVQHCITDEQDASIVRTIVSMAKSLNLKVIAEGVESEKQLMFLTSLGCDAAQGYFIGKPMPAEEFGVWLTLSTANKKAIAV